MIVDALAQSLDRAVLVDDVSLTPITHSRQLGQLDDVRVYSVLQRAIRVEVKAELFGFGIDTATEALWTPALPQHEMLPRYCVPIYSEEERFGYLWVLDPENSLSKPGQELAKQAGRELQTVLDRRNAALRDEQSAQQALLTRLLSAGTGEPFDPILRELQAKDMAQPDSQMSVFVFEAPSTGPGDPVERSLSLRLLLTASEASHRWFTLSGDPSAAFAVSRPESHFDAGAIPTSVIAALGSIYGERPVIGWSGDRVPISQAAQAFQHARLAMSLGQIGASTEDVTVWTTLDSWKTIALLAESYSNNHADLAALVHPGIVGLLNDGRADLVHTLDVYLAHGGDARKTAAALYLHRSTLYYRLEKISEAIGADLSNGETRFGLLLSIRLARMAHLYSSDTCLKT
ncbi:MAG TPA: helix-turn-helix domain-containing protein [Mycobacterium sp.]|nr:helix-turn-helix domain-containing protein [Mycobacterium sp.]